jgi:hypothetical protein
MLWLKKILQKQLISQLKKYGFLQEECMSRESIFIRNI